MKYCVGLYLCFWKVSKKAPQGWTQIIDTFGYSYQVLLLRKCFTLTEPQQNMEISTRVCFARVLQFCTCRSFQSCQLRKLFLTPRCSLFAPQTDHKRLRKRHHKYVVVGCLSALMLTRFEQLMGGYLEVQRSYKSFNLATCFDMLKVPAVDSQQSRSAAPTRGPASPLAKIHEPYRHTLNNIYMYTQHMYIHMQMFVHSATQLNTTPQNSTKSKCPCLRIISSLP